MPICVMLSNKFYASASLPRMCSICAQIKRSSHCVCIPTPEGRGAREPDSKVCSVYEVSQYSPRNVFVLELCVSQPKFGTTHLEVCLCPIRVLSDAEIKDTRTDNFPSAVFTWLTTP